MPYTEQFSETIARRGIGSPYERDITGAALHTADNALIKAIIATESQWVPGAINMEGTSDPARWSYGLMQVRLATARGIEPGILADALLVPATNVRIGAAYLHYQRRRFPEMTAAVSAYNAGRPITANEAYVTDVMRYYAWYLEHDRTIPLELELSVPASFGWPWAVALAALLYWIRPRAR